MKLTGHYGWVMCASFTPDGQRIVSGSDDGTLLQWDANSGQVIGAPMLGHQGRVNCLAISSDGRKVISGSVDYSLKIWDLKSMRTIEDKKGHEGNVTCVSY